MIRQFARDRYRKEALHVTLEPMQAKCWHVYSFKGGRRLQGRKNKPDPVQHIRRQFLAVILLERELQAFMAGIPDHRR